jgi:hypothetical protein
MSAAKRSRTAAEPHPKAAAAAHTMSPEETTTAAANLRRAVVLLLPPETAADVPSDYGSYMLAEFFPKALQERAVWNPFAKLFALLFLAGVFPAGPPSWGPQALLTAYNILKEDVAWDEPEGDSLFEHVLTTGKAEEVGKQSQKEQQMWLQNFNLVFRAFADCCKLKARVPPTYGQLIDRLALRDQRYAEASLILPEEAAAAAPDVVPQFVAMMVNAEVKAAAAAPNPTDEAQTETIHPSPDVIDEPIREQYDLPPLTPAELVLLGVTYMLAFGMYRAQPTASFKGYVVSAFEALMRTLTGRLHWQSTSITKAAAKLILAAYDVQKRATVHRAHGLPLLDAHGNRVVFPEYTNLTRHERALLVFQRDHPLSAEEVWSIWCENDKTTLVTPDEHKNEQVNVVSAGDRISIPRNASFLFTAAGYGVAIRKAEIKFLQACKLDGPAD